MQGIRHSDDLLLSLRIGEGADIDFVVIYFKIEKCIFFSVATVYLLMLPAAYSFLSPPKNKMFV